MPTKEASHCQVGGKKLEVRISNRVICNTEEIEEINFMRLYAGAPSYLGMTFYNLSCRRRRRPFAKLEVRSWRLEAKSKK